MPMELFTKMTEKKIRTSITARSLWWKWNL